MNRIEARTIKEVRAESTNQPLQEDLEHSSSLQALNKAQSSREKVVHASSTDLEDAEKEEWDDERQESRQPDRN